uniref:Serine/threonine-protein kinase BSK n=1 Tax=Brassica campestris TaxID=3711 RepID=A0A3P5ZRY7_BRACM|nr:unnamed protein product [Brassica rapa]
MGCFQSKDADHVITSPDHPSVQHQLESVTEEQVDHEDQVDHENQVEQENQIPCGVKDFNEVYIGKLEGNVLVAVKRFSKLTWPDARHFVDQATAVGKLRSKIGQSAWLLR